MKPPPIPPERIAGELSDSVRGELAVRERERRDRRGHLIALVLALCFVAALVGFAWVLIARGMPYDGHIAVGATSTYH